MILHYHLRIINKHFFSETLVPLDGGDASPSRKLYDHQPLNLNEDDFERVSRIPKKKVRLFFGFIFCGTCFKHLSKHLLFMLLPQGANFRDLGGVLVQNNRVIFDPSVERLKVKSGKFLVQINQRTTLSIFSSSSCFLRFLTTRLVLFTGP